MKPFWLALQFMSRLPTPQFDSISAQEMGRSIQFFPIVGLIVGSVLVASAQLHFFLPNEIVAGLVLAVWAWVTGALHLDGLADTADGWLGGVGNQQRALEIMKDSRIGTGGGVALVIILLLKWLALTYLIVAQSWLWLLFIPLIARVAAIGLMPFTPYVSLQGLAEEMVLNLNRWGVFVWLGLVLLVLIWLAWPLALGLIGVWLWMRWLMIRITGGMTGDTAGAMTEVMELAMMIGLIAFLGLANS
ncbi:adenosylcobinamide-GDP ribazoletransferase [Thiomicrorhabdus immobilis]|uniref:Adenosylcobinamide-GDP ribazoletransferase n=1 Tax=Thiomicrorhabdus immobilis TaxID=2791037 RepID=A0ABN6CZ79_9GAMM|nr:adenosylcobinamide-GDP ribazoletransferase [Thiomicrorhabdus immobilis]BCN93192.1 adenosylcobinamide-GDP ribazoletransferase [Thiomicrorhabdus immobilis]